MSEVHTIPAYMQTALDKLDLTMSQTGDIRNMLIDKLKDSIVDYELDLEHCKPSDRESFMAVVNGLAGQLKDKESAAQVLVKNAINLERNANEQDGNSNMAELLAMFGTGVIKPTVDGATLNEADADADLEKQMAAAEETLGDGEIDPVEDYK